MILSIKDYLQESMLEMGISASGVQLPDARLDPETIRVIMINEVPPGNPEDWFYSNSANPGYMQTTLALFRDAGVNAGSIGDLLGMGIYITTAVKSPKTGYAVDPAAITGHLPILEREIDLFPNLLVVMLMGDVAKKAFNMIAKKRTKKNCIPSGSTYKIRGNEFFFGDLRVFPSYIMTGGNILIEKAKREMISDDIRRMMQLL